MIPEITHINGVQVVNIPGFGGIAPVFITPEKTLTVRGTGFTDKSAIATIGLDEVNTQTVKVTVSSLKTGKTISDLLDLVGRIKIGGVFGDIAAKLLSVTEPAEGKADILRSPDPRFIPPNELKAYVPSLWEFQTTSLDLLGFKARYERNSVVLPFAICVYDSATGKNSTPVIIPAVLPLPEVGEPKITGEKVLIGAVPGPSKDRTDHFGKNPEVRWYDEESLKRLFSFNLGDLSIRPETPQQNTGDIKSSWSGLMDTVARSGQSVSRGIFEKLAAIRMAGELVTPVESRNEGVRFDSPQSRPFGTIGFIVVWRDDLPSRPVSIINLGIGNKDQVRAMIQEAADKLFSFLPPLRTNVPLPPGQAVTFGLQKLAQGMDNLLVRLLDSKHSGIGIKFKFKVTGQNVQISKVSDGVKGDSIQPDAYSSTVVPGADPNGQFQVRVVPVSDLVPEETATDRDMMIELFAEISLPSCVFSDIRIGPAVTFKVEPLKIPTIAVFFTGTSCGSAPLIMLPKDTAVVPEDYRNRYWDITGMVPPPTKAGQKYCIAEEMRIAILSKLIRLKETVELIKLVCGFHPLPWMDKLEHIVGHLAGGASAVIDTTGRIDDLGYRIYGSGTLGPESFGRRIESVLLIGPPLNLGGRRILCFSETNCSGFELALNVPEGESPIPERIAAFDSLRDLNKKLNVGGKELELIEATQDPAGPTLNWGGAIASIKFE